MAETNGTKNPHNVPLCIWHKGCVDGFTSAWVVWRFLNGLCDFHEGVYNESPPDVLGRNVIMVDFSYPAEVIGQMENDANAMLILDHHKTAEAALRPWTQPWPELTPALPVEGCVAHFDMERSGAGLAWDYFYGGFHGIGHKPRPRIINHVEDRDLWKFQILGTREIGAVLYSHPFDFMVWESLAMEMEDDANYNSMQAQGHAIDRAHKKNCQQLAVSGRRMIKIGGVRMPAVNAPYFMASDIGHILASEPGNTTHAAAVYYDMGDGKRVFSLRSNKKADDPGLDVSAIAKTYGGGGHHNAAGFTAPFPNWQGDE
jgi:oligoribonuclease NrnB/cAMP/cGMP phosphodiesterase (DHH superfamily)